MSYIKILKAEGCYKLKDMQESASVANTADGLFLAGPNFKLGCLKACPDMLLFACEKLAKANERVAELESQHQLLTKRIEPLLDMQEDGEHYARCHLADDIYEAFIEGSSVDALNKFAIEQQIEGLKDYQALCGFADCRKSIDARIEQLEQKLRKEQEH